MRKRLIFGLIASPSLIIFSVVMSLYIYHYETTNRVGAVGDLEFHFSSILPFICLFISGICSLIVFISAAHRDLKKKNPN